MGMSKARMVNLNDPSNWSISPMIPEIPAESLQEQETRAKAALEELGRPRISEITAWLDLLPAMRELLKKERVSFSSGTQHSWQHCVATYEMPDCCSLVELLGKMATRRIAAMMSVVDCVEDQFQKQHPHADLAVWKLVLLEGWWLKETVVVSEGKVVVFMDATFAFEECRKEQVSPDVVV